MATRSGQHYSTSSSSSGLDAQNVLTLKGYTELFEKREDASDVFSGYEILYRKKNMNDWVEELSSKNHSSPVNRLFNWHRELFPKDKQKKPGDIINIIQSFTLLENVYRNVLLRPYIPAYRTINTDCGRYRSFIEPLGGNIFEQLGFEYHSPNLFTYMGIDQSETIKCVVACSILIAWFSEELKRILKRSSNNQ